MAVVFKKGHDAFHVKVELQLLLCLLLLQLLLLLLVKLLLPQQSISSLLYCIRGTFCLFLEMSPPIIFYLIVSSPWQAPGNCWPPEVFGLANKALNKYVVNRDMQVQENGNWNFTCFPTLYATLELCFLLVMLSVLSWGQVLGNSPISICNSSHFFSILLMNNNNKT